MLLSEVWDDFASIASPLTQKSKIFEWSEACNKTFQLLKDRLTSAPVLTLSNGTNGIVVYCDASQEVLGRVIMHQY